MNAMQILYRLSIGWVMDVGDPICHLFRHSFADSSYVMIPLRTMVVLHEIGLVDWDGEPKHERTGIACRITESGRRFVVGTG